MLRIGNDPENGISSSINIHKGTGRIGISRDPTRYMFDVSGSFNCTNLNVNGKPFIGGGGGGSSEFILEDTNTYDFIEYIPGEAPDGTSGSSVWDVSSDSIYYTTGNVGIGTTNPLSSLHVAGSTITSLTKGIHMGLAGNIDATIELCNGGTSGQGSSLIDFTQAGIDRKGRILYSFGDDSMRFETTNGTTTTERLQITSTGNVGIGTGLPSAKLTVRKDGLNQVMQTWVGDLGTNNGRTLHILSPDTDSADAPFKFTTGNAITFRIDQIEALNINSGGKVGIGTSSFSNELDISGNARMDRLIIGDDLDSTGNVSVVIKDNGTGNGHGNVTSAGGLRIVSTAPQVSGSVDLLMGVNHNSKYAFLQSTEYAIQHQNLIFQPVGGNVGIGTTSPQEKLHVVSDSIHLFLEGATNNDVKIQSCPGPDFRTTGKHEICFGHYVTYANRGHQNYIDFKVNDGLQTSPPLRMRINGNGNVGIGTDSPSELLHLSGTGDVKLLIEADVGNSGEGDLPTILMTQDGSKIYHAIGGNQTDNAFRIECGKDDSGANFISSTECPIVFHTGGIGGYNSGSERMRIAQNGNVGIGTDSPNEDLTIKSGSSAKMALISNHDDSSNLSTFYISTPSQSAQNSNDFALKTAIIAEGAGWSRSNLHFCLKNALNHNDSAYTATVADSKMVIDYDGNVGIGTTSPQSLFHVKDGVLLTEDTTNTNRLILYSDAGGNGGTNDNHYQAGAYDKFGSAIFTNDTGTTGSTITLVNKESGNNVTKHASIGFVNTDTSGVGKFGGQIGFWPEDVNAVKQQFRIYTSGASAGYNLPVQRMVVTGDGNVGIGTTSPSEHLTVQSAAGTNATFSVTTQNENKDAILFLGTPNGATAAKKCAIIAKGGSAWSTNDLHFCLNSQQGSASLDANNSSYSASLADSRMVIKSTGNVGIGTTSPLENLTVENTGETTFSVAAIGEDANAIIYLGTSVNGSSDIHSRNGRKCAIIAEGADYWGTNKLHFCLNSSVGSENRPTTASLTDSRMVIQKNGNVGIGTTSPSSLLSVSSTTTSDVALLDLFSDAGTGTTQTKIRLTKGTNYGGSIGGYLEQGVGSGLAFNTINGSTDTEKMRITSAGNVGIGTSSPTEMLSVGGTILCVGENNGLIFERDSSTFNNATTHRRFIMDMVHRGSVYGDTLNFSYVAVGPSVPTGNATGPNYGGTPTVAMTIAQIDGMVGIGTTSPAQKLHVDGTIRAGDAEIGTWSGGSSYVVFSHKDHTGSGYAVLHQSNGATWINAANNQSIRFGINDITKMIINNNGNEVYGNCRATSFISTSDDRVKHNETPLTNSLELISQLHPKRYLKTREMYDASLNLTIDASGNYTDISENDLVTEEIGIIAQEVQSIQELSFLVKPSLDISGNETGPMGLDYQSLFVLSIKAIQEQQTMIQQQQTMIESLVQRLDAIEANQS